MSALSFDRAGALLTVDLAAICDNWRLLKSRAGAADCAAVVKADAYGLGAAQVAPALFDAGCRRFFVAHLDEAIALRPLLAAETTVYVLHGPPPGAEREFVAHGVVPVLNSRAQIDAWRTLADRLGRVLPAIVQVDTGMARLGLAPHELVDLAAGAYALRGIRLDFVMSHLACAEDRAHPANRAQLERFVAARRLLPAAPASFANSSGFFLGDEYHFDLVRPGAALYGIAPVAGAPNPMRPVVRLQGKVVQTRDVRAGTPVGYGHAWQSDGPARITTVSVGYADGWLRALGNRASAWIEGFEMPVVGRVSMDTITLDASAVPESAIGPGMLVDLIGERQGVDEVAARAGTIGYEVLTSLGSRYARRYVGQAAQA
jgi:alanine racemase